MEECTLPAVPPREVVDTGDPERVAEIINTFFESVLEFCNLTTPTSRQFSQWNYYGCIFGSAAAYHPSPARQFATDETLTTLVVCDILVASAICRRRNYNDIEVTCALYITADSAPLVRLVDGQFARPG